MDATQTEFHHARVSVNNYLRNCTYLLDKIDDTRKNCLLISRAHSRSKLECNIIQTGSDKNKIFRMNGLASNYIQFSVHQIHKIGPHATQNHLVIPKRFQ